MMKRKSILGALLTVSMVGSLAMSVMAADTNEDGTVNNPEAVEVDENKLVFWSLFSGGDGEFMDQVIAQYNEQTSSKEVQSIMLVWADYYTKLQTAVAAGKGPDVGISHASKLPELVDQGVVIPLNDYLDELGINLTAEYAANSIESVTFDDEIYAIPLDTHAQILYYNIDILEEAGIEFNEDGTLDINSADEFRAMCDQVKEVLGDGQSVISCTNSGTAGDELYRAWWSTYFQMGGTPLVSEDGSEVTMDKDIAVAAAEYVKSLFDDGYIIEGITDHQQLFQAGNAAFCFSGTWAVGAFEQTENLNFGGQAWPQLFDNAECWADSHTLVLPVNPDRTEEETLAAVEFIYWASSVGGQIWAQSGQIPSNQNVLSSDEFQELPLRANYMADLELAVLPSKNPNFYAMKAGMIESLDLLFASGESAEDAIDALYDELDSNL